MNERKVKERQRKNIYDRKNPSLARKGDRLTVDRQKLECNQQALKNQILHLKIYFASLSLSLSYQANKWNKVKIKCFQIEK